MSYFELFYVYICCSIPHMYLFRLRFLSLNETVRFVMSSKSHVLWISLPNLCAMCYGRAVIVCASFYRAFSVRLDRMVYSSIRLANFIVVNRSWYYSLLSTSSNHKNLTVKNR